MCRNSSKGSWYTSLEWYSKISLELICYSLNLKGDAGNGNHNWIEVFDHRYHLSVSRFDLKYLFIFTDYRPGTSLRQLQQVNIFPNHFQILLLPGSGETLANPCDKWFCSPDRMKGGTQVDV